MTDKQASNIVLLILLVALMVICYRTQDSVPAAIAYFIAIYLLCQAGRAAYKWLEK